MRENLSCFCQTSSSPPPILGIYMFFSHDLVPFFLSPFISVSDTLPSYFMLSQVQMVSLMIHFVKYGYNLPHPIP